MSLRTGRRRLGRAPSIRSRASRPRARKRSRVRWSAQVSPTGDLYVGNIRDSGWGGGSNTGSLVRLRWRGDLPAGIAEVRARPGGFAIDFTDAGRSPHRRPTRQATRSRRTAAFPRPATAGPTSTAASETDPRGCAWPTIAAARALDVDDLREGFVYEFHLRNLVTEWRVLSRRKRITPCGTARRSQRRLGPYAT